MATESTAPWTAHTISGPLDPAARDWDGDPVPLDRLEYARPVGGRFDGFPAGPVPLGVLLTPDRTAINPAAGYLAARGGGAASRAQG